MKALAGTGSASHRSRVREGSIRSTSLSGWVGTAWDALLAFVYPTHCLSCKDSLEANGPDLCAACWEELQTISGPTCTRCGCPSESPCPRCANCQDKAFRFSAMRTLAPFGAIVQDLVHGLKYQGRTSVARVLGRALGESLLESGFGCGADTVAPVPLHGARQRERGYNQSALIARAASEVLGLPANAHLLARVRHTPTQTELGQAERIGNVSGAFRVRKPTEAAGARILLVDDVITTGATCDACAEALLADGAEEVLVCGLASPYFTTESSAEGDEPIEVSDDHPQMG